MADKTFNYSLIKPSADDFYDIDVQNQNMDIIDTQLKILADSVANVEKTTNKNKPNGYLGLNANGKYDSTKDMRMGVLSYTMKNDEDVLDLSLYTPKYVHLVSTDVIYGHVTLPQDVPTGWDVTIKSDIDAVVTSGTFNYTMYRNESYLFVKSESGYHVFIVDAFDTLFTLFFNCEFKQNKGEANGYVPLDNNKLIPIEYIPQNKLTQNFANVIVNETSGVNISVSDVQEYTNARSLIIDGKTVEDPAINLISQTDFGYSGQYEDGWHVTTEFGYQSRRFEMYNNQTVNEWGSNSAYRIYLETNEGVYPQYAWGGTTVFTQVGKKYRFKLKVKNNNNTDVIIMGGSRTIATIQPNTYKIIDWSYIEDLSDVYLWFGFYSPNGIIDIFVEDPAIFAYTPKSADNPYKPIGVGESGNITTIVKTPNLISNADFSNGTTNWGSGGGVLSVENGWLKAYHSLTVSPSTVVFQDLSMSIPAQTKLFARIKMKVTHTNSSYIRLYLAGTDEAGTDTSLTFEKNSSTLEAGKEYVLYGIITTSKDFAKISYRAQQVFDSGDIALGSSLYIKDCLLINMGSNESNPLYNLTADEMNAKYPDFMPYGETVYETTLPAPLYALSDSKKDYVDITEGKVYKITNKIVCDGSENWGLTSSQPSDNSLARFGLTRSNFASQALGIYSHGNWFGNMFVSHPEGAGVSGTQIVVHIAKARMQGWDDSMTNTQKVNLFKNWLASQVLLGQPVTFVYELDIPQTLTITPQIIPLYTPATIISTSDELQPNIKLTYNRDSNKVIADLQNQINQLKSALALL